ncbi:hypothetical protein MMUR_05710 [Mycolicibacterium murale]|uniref:Uncharacterized protein n=1 Tax=Mycolicibacterium murale TaxID=182220 RepID=A0A7I9WFB2_9MYCO|nr:hypothetical protein MMUR_05710 [Mycolicibacterium murale]
MPQLAGDPVTDHGRAHGFGDDEPDTGTVRMSVVVMSMDYEIRLRRPGATSDSGTELGGPGHPILRGEQRRRLPV